MSHLGIWLLIMTNQQYPQSAPAEVSAHLVANSTASAQTPNIVRVFPDVVPKSALATGGPPLRHPQQVELQKSYDQPKQKGVPERKTSS